MNAVLGSTFGRLCWDCLVDEGFATGSGQELCPECWFSNEEPSSGSNRVEVLGDDE
jgi:hypothetical protein